MQATFDDPQFDTRGAKRELQADCIAGILLYGVSDEIGFTAQDAREAIEAAYSIGSKSHGSPYERAYALKSGFSGNPNDCYSMDKSKGRVELPKKQSDSQPIPSIVAEKKPSVQRSYQPSLGTNSQHPSAAKSFYITIDAKSYRFVYKENSVWLMTLWDADSPWDDKGGMGWRDVPIDFTVDCTSLRRDGESHLGVSLNKDPWSWRSSSYLEAKVKERGENFFIFFMQYAFLKYACEGKIAESMGSWGWSLDW